MKTLPKKTYQVWAAESVDTDNCNAVTPLTAHALDTCTNLKMAYDREEA